MLRKFFFIVFFVILAVMYVAAIQENYEDFEDQAFTNWTEAGGACTWSIIQGQTAGRSASTGANLDRSGSSTGYFAYVETSGSVCTASDPATLNYSNSINGDAYAINVSFWWHAYGADVGTLYLQANNGSGWTEVWSQTGQEHISQTSSWNYTDVNLSDWTGTVDVRFHYDQSPQTSFNGDIEIDELNITLTSRGGEGAINGPSCTYNNGDWVVDISDNCRISSDVEVEGGDSLIITGDAGSFIIQSGATVTADNFYFTTDDFDGDSEFYIETGGQLTIWPR